MGQNGRPRRGLSGRGNCIFRGLMVHLVPKPKSFPGARALDTDWMRQKPPFWAKRQYPVMCAGAMRFARDFRNLRSLWDPSDMCKRIGHEDCVVRRTALPKTPPVRTARLLWPFLGPDAGVFASALAPGHLGPRQMTDVHLGLLFDEDECPVPRPWGNVAGRQKCPFRLVSLPKPALRVIRTCPDSRGILLPPSVRAVAGQSAIFATGAGLHCDPAYTV